MHPWFRLSFCFPNVLYVPFREQAQLAVRFNEGSNTHLVPLHPASLGLLRVFFAPYTARLFGPAGLLRVPFFDGWAAA